MSLIDNEQIKLTATFANGCAVALIAIGTLAPWLTGQPRAEIGNLAIQSLVCLSVAIALHLWARRFLRRLKP